MLGIALAIWSTTTLLPTPVVTPQSGDVPVGKIIREDRIERPRRLVWEQSSAAVLVQFADRNLVRVPLTGPLAPLGQKTGEVLWSDSISHIVHDRDSGKLIETDNAWSKTKEILSLPVGTALVPYFDKAENLLVAIVDESKVLQQAVLMKINGEVLYRTSFAEYASVWDAAYSPKLGVLLVANNSYGWVAGSSFGIHVRRVDAKRTLWDPVPLNVEAKPWIVQVLPPTQTTFLTDNSVARFIMEPREGFYDALKKPRMHGFSTDPWVTSVPADVLPFTTLAIWSASFDFRLDKQILRIDGTYPPIKAAVSPDGQKLALGFRDKLVLVDISALRTLL